VLNPIQSVHDLSAARAVLIVTIHLDFISVFTRDSIYAIASICCRPSVCLSVTRVYHTKTVEDRIMKLVPSGSAMILVF